MDISIIVPVYNVEKTLCRCLDSLLNQRVSETISYEIICVNDVSPDNSQVILESYQKNYPNIVKIIRNSSNVGLGNSRDKGIAAAKGDYVMFVDSDDSVKNDYICTYFNEMIKEPCDIIVGSYISVFHKKHRQHKIPDSEWSQLTFVSACAKLYRRGFILENNLMFSNIRYAEDTYMSLFAFAANPKVRYINYAGYYYYYNPESITHKNVYDKNFEKMMSAIYDDFLAKHEITKFSMRSQRIIEYAYIAHMLNTILVYNKGCKWSRMSSKYDFFIRDLSAKFPDYMNNPYIGLFKPKGQRLKTRIGVYCFKLTKKIHIPKMLFWVASH